MAQLNDTMVQGDLRVTGAIYGNKANLFNIDTNNFVHYNDTSVNSQTIATAVSNSGNMPRPSMYLVTSAPGFYSYTSLSSFSLYSPYTCQFDGIKSNSNGNPVWYHAEITGTTWTEDSTPLLYTSSTISSVDDLEPLLTAGRLFHFNSGTRSTAALTAIGKCPNDTPDNDYTFSGFGLCYAYNTTGILRYSSSYVIAYNYEPQGGYTPVYAPSNMKFWGTSYMVTSNYYASNSTCSLLFQTDTSAGSKTVNCTDKIYVNPSTNTLTIAGSNANVTLSSGGLRFTPDTSATKAVALIPTVGTDGDLTVRYYQTSAQSTGSITASKFNGVATNAEAYSTSFTGTNSIYSALLSRMPLSVSTTSTAYNFNTLTTTGVYLLVVAKTTSTNKPYDDLSGRCAMIILNSDGYVTQTVFENHVYYRYSNVNNPGTSSSDWNAWQTL